MPSHGCAKLAGSRATWRGPEREGEGVEMGWLVCDYGEVLSRRPTKDDEAKVAEMCGLDLAELQRRYWVRRIDYDRGDIDARTFWEDVAGASLDDDRLEACVAADAEGWMRLDERTTAAVERAAERGWRLALLSNAPVEISRRLDALAWLGRFELRIFSCDLRLTKPDPAIYVKMLDLLDAEAGEVVFVDDRAANVAAARELGIRSLLFTGPEVFDVV